MLFSKFVLLKLVGLLLEMQFVVRPSELDALSSALLEQVVDLTLGLVALGDSLGVR